MEKYQIVKAVALIVSLFTCIVITVDFMFMNSNVRGYLHAKVISRLTSSSENQIAHRIHSIHRKGNSTCSSEAAFPNTLLVLTFNFPFYSNIPILREMYDDAFAKIIMCGPKAQKKDFFRPDIEVEITRGYFGYRCATKAMELYPGYNGYVYGNDDMIINWWNLVDRDKSKLWQGAEIVRFSQDAFGEIKNKGWIWWTSGMGIKACQGYYNDLEKLAQNSHNAKTLLKTFLDNGFGKPKCGRGWSDFFYIPGKHAKNFVTISTIASKNKLFLEIAVNNILRTLDRAENFEVIKGTFLPDLGVGTDAKSFWKTYTTNLTFIHPYKMNLGDKEESLNLLRTRYVEFSKSKLKELCKS